MKSIFGYRSIWYSTIVAATFSIVVCALLLLDGAQRLNKVPLEAPEFVALQKQFIEQPNDEALRQKIRELDLALRQEYFREQRFTRIGSNLLLGGVAVTLLFGRWAATLRRKIPTPKPKGPGPDSDERLSRSGVWAVGVVIVALVGTSWAMHVHYRSVLPATVEDLVVALDDRTEEPDLDDGMPPQVAQTVPDLPTAEEYQRNWPSFRGPNGAGISHHQNVPTEWNGVSDEGILWKTPVPLPGVNSPVLWKGRLFLSGATEDVREIYCFDADSGSILWKKQIATDPLIASQEVKTNRDTGYAAPTMATDGRFVFAMFADGLVTAVDFSGNEVWRRSLGIPQKNNYGHASSLATHKGSVIVQFDHGSADDQLSKLFALDGETGEPIWETAREMPASWSSPIVIDDGDQTRIITCGDPWVIAYSADDGTEIWRAHCLKRAEVGPTPVFSDGMVYAGNDSAVFAAIRTDGKGDVTDSHIQWTVDYGLPDTCSPLVVGDVVLTLTSYGTLSCFDKKQADEPLWEEEFDADFASSPSLVGDHVYLFGRKGTTWIVKPTREQCERIAEAALGEECVTSPAFQDGRIFIRGSEHLFCIGNRTRDEN